MLDFNSWLEGYLEGKESLDNDQVKVIKDKMVCDGVNKYIDAPFYNPALPYITYQRGVIYSTGTGTGDCDGISRHN